MFDIGLFASFGAGVISFLSPCILPLVPPYLCFLAGTSLEELTTAGASPPRGRAVLRAIAFVAGFAVVFVILGAGASTLGRLATDHLAWLSRVAGAVIVLIGLHMSGLMRFDFLLRQVRLETAGPIGLFGAFVVGLAFGFGWTPCVGPVLAAILLLAGTQDSVGDGIALLAAYAAGIGVPFIVAAALTGAFLRFAARFRRHLHKVEIAMGLMLIMTGVVIATGFMPVIGNWLTDIIPALGRIG